jgi:pimeloyl-ACP methyl ester carboxylesterase
MVTITTDTVTSQDGTTIAFDCYGDGPALVLVSGASSVRAYAAGLATVLAPHFAVYAYDRRGRGDSGDTPPYAVEREIEDLDAVIHAAGGSALVLGHSSGAVLALRAAAAGVPISKLAVYEPPFIVDDSRPPAPDGYVAHLDELVSQGNRGDAYAYFMTEVVRIPAEIVNGMRANPAWQGMEAVAHTLAYDGRVMADTMSGKPLPAEPWNRITVPVLVMDGGASPTHMRTGTDALAARIPNAERKTLAGQGHGPADDVLAPVLVEFFTA